jgi:Concanavalin A-like lectin/glucanases superfamily
MARRLARRALLSALALSLLLPLSMDAAYGATGPFITVINPPLVTPTDGSYPADVLAPTLRMKQYQANGIDTFAAYFCLPNPAPPPPVPPGFKIVVFFHTVFKPFNAIDAIDGFFGGGLVNDVTGGSFGGGVEGDGNDDISDFIAVGVPFMQLPRDELGNYKMMVFCAEAPPFGKKTAKVAYSVEPLPYKDYVNADNPRAYWRLGESKGDGTMADATANDLDGDYRNGVALERDGAPNCNVESRATTGCNDSTLGGIFSETVSDHDTAAFFHTGGYGYVNDMTAPGGAYSIEAWVNPFDTSDQMIFQHGYGPALYIKDGKFVFRQTDQDIVQASGDEPAAGEWSHVVGTWNGIDIATLYVNGVDVAASNTATKPPSGISTAYVGDGDVLPQSFHGTIDEVAYYPSELPEFDIGEHYVVGTYVMPQSAAKVTDPMTYHMDTTRPKVTVHTPTEGAVFNEGKVPAFADFEGEDVDVFIGLPAGLLFCPPVPLLATPGSHTAIMTCTDKGANVKTVTRNYTVGDFSDVIQNDDPVGYWRLGDAPSSHVMEGDGVLPDGEYKNDTTGGVEGVSGDQDTTRAFLGKGGYGYVNGIEHPREEYSIQAWVDPADDDDAMIAQHGRGAALYIKGGKVVFRQTDVEVQSTIPAGDIVPGETFHQVVGTWDGVYARLYIDDVLQGTDVYAPTPPSGFSTFYVGYGEFAPWFRGNLDELSYFPAALTPERVHEHFIADPPPKGLRVSPGADDPIDVINAAPSETGPSAVGNPDSIPVSPSEILTPRGPKASVSVRGRASVARNDGKLVVRLPFQARCPKTATGPCQVAANLSGRSGAGIAASLGGANRQVAAGRAWDVKLTLNRTAARALRRGDAVKVLALVAVQAPDAKIATKTASLTLRLRGR